MPTQPLVDATFARAFEPVALQGLSDAVVSEYLNRAEAKARNQYERAGGTWPSATEASDLLTAAIVSIAAAEVMRTRRLDLYDGVVRDAQAKEAHALATIAEAATRDTGDPAVPTPDVTILRDSWGEETDVTEGID